MSRRLQYCLAVYLLGTVVMGAYLVSEAIEKGGLQRLAGYGFGEIAFLVVAYVVMSALWPIIVIVLAYHFGSLLLASLIYDRPARGTCMQQHPCGAKVSAAPNEAATAQQRIRLPIA
jgi:hypothetical protein